jgi:hypothetical protein
MMRNSLNFQWSDWSENPPTLQNALDFIKSNHINMVIALDIKDSNSMMAAWRVIADNWDWQGTEYTFSTLFKFDATYVFPQYGNFQNAFNTRYLGFQRADYNYMNIIPVWQTSGINPNGGYGSEEAMVNAAINYSYPAYTVGIEMNQKQPGGIGSGIPSYIYGTGAPLALANFNPYAEWIDPNDSYGTYQFFYSNGYCCGVPRNWFYNGAPYGQRSDTDDQRTQWPFLLDEGIGFNLITTDNVVPMLRYLQNEGRRNISYLQ